MYCPVDVFYILLHLCFKQCDSVGLALEMQFE